MEEIPQAVTYFEVVREDGGYIAKWVGPRGERTGRGLVGRAACAPRRSKGEVRRSMAYLYADVAEWKGAPLLERSGSVFDDIVEELW